MGATAAPKPSQLCCNCESLGERLLPRPVGQRAHHERGHTKAEDVPSEIRTLGRRTRGCSSHHPSECVQTSLSHCPPKHASCLMALTVWGHQSRKVSSSGSMGHCALPCRPEGGWGRGEPTLTASQGSLGGRAQESLGHRTQPQHRSRVLPLPHSTERLGLVQGNVYHLVCPLWAGMGWTESWEVRQAPQIPGRKSAVYDAGIS